MDILVYTEDRQTERQKGRNGTLNELAKEIHKNAVAHGFWEPKQEFPATIALCHSELSEALEEYREGNELIYHVCDMNCGERCEYVSTDDCPDHKRRPEGIAVEMADCLIRILDWAAHAGVDMDAVIAEKMAYNKTRPFKHGKKC